MKEQYYILIFLIIAVSFLCGYFCIKPHLKSSSKAQKIVDNEFDSSLNYISDYSVGGGAADSELKILVIGNSISSGVIVDNIKDDYVNVLIRKISKKLNNRLVTAKVYNLANFERHYKNYDYDVLRPLKEYNPSIIIFQLGENYKSDDDALYLERFIRLVNYFDGADLKIVTSPYWGKTNKNKLNENAALATNSFYVDISNLFMYDKKTRADYNKKFENEALGMHPGEYGMQRIAEEIFILINACIHKNII